MESKFVTLPAFTVVGMKYYGKNENNEIKAMWQEYLPRMKETKHTTGEHVSYGICDAPEEDGNFIYIAGLKVTSKAFGVGRRIPIAQRFRQA